MVSLAFDNRWKIRGCVRICGKCSKDKEEADVKASNCDPFLGDDPIPLCLIANAILRVAITDEGRIQGARRLRIASGIL